MNVFTYIAIKINMKIPTPARTFDDKCPERAGRPGLPLWVAGRGSLISESPWVAGRAARVGGPPRPCQPLESMCDEASDTDRARLRSGSAGRRRRARHGRQAEHGEGLAYTE